MFVPAGFSPGTGDSARGERRREFGMRGMGAVGIAALAGRFASVHAQPCGSIAAFCLSLRPALRFYRRVLPQFMPGLATLARLLPSVRAFGLAVLAERLSSVCARHCGSIAVFCLGSRLLFAALRQTERLAVSCVPVPPGRDRHSCVLAALARLSAFVGSLRVWPFICGDLDGVTGDAGNGERGTGLRGLTARPL